MARRKLTPPVRFTFDGLYSSAIPGETLLQALSRRRVPILSRSIKYHRPRGPLCGTGQCASCLVRVNGAPNQRACRTFPQEGDRIRTENAWPSVRLDLFGAFDLIFPRHLDTLHGFRRPLFLRPAYHAVVRRLAGTGKLPTSPTEGSLGPDPRAGPLLSTYLVVGGGASGSRAARALADAPGHRSVRLLDRGGASALGKGPLPPNLHVERRTSLLFLPPPATSAAPFVGIAAREGGGAVEVWASKVLLAPGGYDAFLLFTGNDRPGVLTADGALALRQGGRVPFRRALIFGGGRRAETLIKLLKGRVAAVAAPGPLEAATGSTAKALSVPTYPGHLLVASKGRRRVHGALLRDRKTGQRTSMKVDAIVLAHRRVPNVPLYFQVGAKMHWREGTGAFYPDLDASGCTSVPRIYAAGEGAGFVETLALEASVDRAVQGMLEGASFRRPDVELPGRVRAEGPNVLLAYYRELLEQPWLGKRVLCPCEDVVLEELDEAVHEGFTGTEVVKRFTGAGTGICQGRYCLPDVLLLLSILEGRPPSEVGFITQRPPVWPVPLGDLARLPAGGVPPALEELGAPPATRSPASGGA
ncbi:MAG: (2Fe-2S)-binding protein [Euryarchaeota archaeon]|nr:(2Fe-2S)-binding protein [Euryarchaeota archaeon]MDE1836446.1 (2Fe-2S)-binding protein [Euryarchaeota archaeon]MDE1879039.1 (2Fe-2S)-binding protein [Euryarchaeota archaeon]MDE2044194.1 (2Fe-2S)-binding protein [Thermoplasmata archaeon]